MKPSANILWMKKIFCAVVLMTAVSLSCGIVAAQSANTNLDKVLAQMDTAAAKFRSAQASFQWDQFEKVVDNTDTQTGIIYYKRAGTSMRTAIVVETANGQPSKKYIVYSDGVLKFYQPEIDQMTVIRAGSRQSDYESYMALGFGASGNELKKSWNITLQGMETIDGVQTAKLDLVGKSNAVRSKFSHITIWVDPARAVSLKQILFEPSGDMRTSYYRNIQYNKPVSNSVFKIKTDAKTQVIEK
jgi:outer membrane lipoprotein-sorting protein